MIALISFVSPLFHTRVVISKRQYDGQSRITSTKHDIQLIINIIFTNSEFVFHKCCFQVMFRRLAEIDR
jgi:pectin methylesterase-like acyl-CoA thioesterase